MGKKRHCKIKGLFFFWRGNEIHQLATGFFVHHRIVALVEKVEFVTGSTSYIVLKGR